MLDIAVLISLAVMTYRVWSGVSREAEIFREFNQARTLAIVSLLFPLAPIILLLGMVHVGAVVSLVGAAVCFLPALVIARRNVRVFERSGTDRVNGAISAASQAVGTAIAGLCYVAVVAVFVLVWQMRGP